MKRTDLRLSEREHEVFGQLSKMNGRTKVMQLQFIVRDWIETNKNKLKT